VPIEGMPDPGVHRICRRCGQWFEAHEGTSMAPEVTGPLGYLRAMRAGIDGSGMRFQCARCTRVRTLTQRIIWGALVVAMAVPLLLEYLGLID